MADVSRSRRASAGLAFLVAGGLVLLGVVLGLAGQALGNWVTLIADLVIATGFVLLALGTAGAVARVALLVGAVGWFLLALGAFVAYPQPLWLLAVLAAAAGGVVGAAALARVGELPGRSGLAFLVTTIAAAVVLLAAAAGVGLDVFGAILSVVFGVGLVVAGILLRRGARGR